MREKFTKKRIISAIALMSAVPACFALAACKDDGKTSGGGEVSGLIGRFTAGTDTEVVLTNDISLLGTSNEDGKPYIYTSNAYPLNTVNNEGLVYATSQTLRLKRDYTYEYTYDILLRKVTQDGNTDLTKMEVTAKGVFAYNQNNLTETFYNVELSAPTEGEELRYGASIADEGNIYSWRLSSAANYRYDVSSSGEGEELDRYLSGRTVRVERGEERVLYDSVFYADLLNDIAPFCSYASVYGKEEQPVQPEDPIKPEEKEKSGDLKLPVKYFGAAGVSLRADGVPALEISAPQSARVTVNGGELSAVNTAEGKSVYLYPVAYAEFANAVEVSAGEQTFSFTPAEYLKETITDEAESTLAEKSQSALCASLLNFAKRCGAEVELTAAQTALLYESLGNNYYHTDWGKRDNMDVSGQSVNGFGWDGLPELKVDGKVTLCYKFHVITGDYLRLNAQFTVGGKTYTAPVTELNTDGGSTYYRAESEAISPADFDGGVAVTVFDGENKISGQAVYSVTRAAAKADLEESSRPLANVVYSLGKSAAWYINRNAATYSYQPPLNGVGRYELKLGAYVYNDGRMSVPAKTVESFGTSLYVDGTLTSDTKGETLGSGYTVTKQNGLFYATLGGVSVDGVRTSVNAPEVIALDLKGVSSLKNPLMPEFGDPYPAAALKSFSDVIITGEKGAILNVYGGIVAQGRLIIDGVTVNVYSAGETAVNCGGIEIVSGGALNVKAGAENTNAGIVCRGGANIDGALRSEGFGTGIYLEGENEFYVRGGGLYLTASDTGLSGGAPAESNRQLAFAGGESYIRAANGVRYGDISVGGASLTVIADAGFTVMEDLPVTIRTTSGDKDKGSLTLINNTYNPYWDVNYTVKVQNLLLNGGAVKLFGMCKDGVIHTGLGSLIRVENCDLTVENGQSLETSYGRGINAQNGDETILFSNSAKVVFKNCDAAVACWGRSGGGRFAELVNEGLIILDGYKVGLAGWEILSWEMKHSVINLGQIRTVNYFG